MWTVYPRVCGGTALTQLGLSGDKGLSPRVRGNHVNDAHRPVYGGSIPACAGEPSVNQDERFCQEVYPRVCGGTLVKTGVNLPAEGLSPRVRGNPGQNWRQSAR